MTETVPTLQWFMREVASVFQTAMEGHPLTLADEADAKAPHRLAIDFNLTLPTRKEFAALSVDDQDETLSRLRGRHVEPTAKALAAGVREAKIVTLIDLADVELPSVMGQEIVTIKSAERGYSLRGITHFGAITVDLLGVAA
jgi:hypothetical protein